MKNAALKNPAIKSSLLYIGLTILLFCLVSATAFLHAAGSPGLYFFTQVCFLGLGTLHAWLLYRFLQFIDKTAFLQGTLATLAVTLIGAMGLVLFLVLLGFAGTILFYVSCLVLFILPFFIAKAFDYFQNVPPKIYKLWHYPVGSPMPDLDTLDLSKILVIQFEFPKKANDTVFTNFKAKAPLEMPFGDLFLVFLNDYNERNPDGELQYINSQNQPFGWIFYKKASWWRRRQYFDPDLTFRANQVIDNDIIVAVRA